MNLIPESFRDLLEPETRAFAVLHTLGNRQSPQSPLLTIMWFSVDGEHILFNSVPTSRKHQNILADSSVHFVIFDPRNMYRYLEIAGTVIHITQEDAHAHNQYLAGVKYGWDDGTFGTNRVTYRVRIDHVRTVG